MEETEEGFMHVECGGTVDIYVEIARQQLDVQDYSKQGGKMSPHSSTPHPRYQTPMWERTPPSLHQPLARKIREPHPRKEQATDPSYLFSLPVLSFSCPLAGSSNYCSAHLRLPSHQRLEKLLRVP